MQEVVRPGPREYISKSISYFRQHFKILFLISYVPQIIIYLSRALTTLLLQSEIQITALIAIPVIVVFLVVLPILTLYSYLLLNVAIIKDVFSISEIFTQAKYYLSRYVRIAVIRGILIAIGLVLLIIPGMIFLYMYYMADIILVDMDVKGTSALKASKEFTKGLRWYIAVNSISLSLFLGIVTLPVTIPAELITNIYLSGLIQTLLGSILMPFIAIYTYYLYNYIKSEKASPPVQPVQPIQQSV